MLDKPENRPPPPRARDGLPYDPQDWNRKLEEARARRAVKLRQRSASAVASAAPAERLASTWDGRPDELAEVFGPVIAHVPAGTPVHAPADVHAPEDPAPAEAEAAAPVQSRRARALTLLAGIALGSSLTVLVVMVSGSAWRQAEPPRDTGLAQASAAAPADGSAGAADAAAPAATDVPSATVPPAEAALPDETATASEAAPEPATPPLAADTSPEDPAETAATAAALVDRVVVHAPRSVSSSVREEAAAVLRDAGWPAEKPRTSPFTISKTQVRYYHAEDRPAAEELAALFSAEARDFTGYSPRPPDGMIELWLAGRASARHQQQRRQPTLQDVLGRIAQALDGRG